MFSATPLTDYFKRKPKLLFLIDGSGALLTAFLLFVVLSNFSEYVGMPQLVLDCLSIIAFSFSIYSFACYLFLKNRWPVFINIIAIANLLYCAATLFLLFAYYQQLTVLAVLYFSLEIGVIIVLCSLEFRVASKLQSGTR